MIVLRNPNTLRSESFAWPANIEFLARLCIIHYFEIDICIEISLCELLFNLA